MSDQVKEEIEWTDKKQLEYAENFYNVYSKKIKEEPEKAFEELLAHVAFLSGQVQQLKEAFYHNHKVSKGAFDNSHKAVELYQQLESSQKIQAGCFSKRLEKLER